MPSPTTPSGPDFPRESAPERDYGAPEPRPAPIESDFDRGERSAASDHWSPPPAEASYRDEPREQPSTSSASASESAPPNPDERQAG
jgi:hypothetical protein